MSLTKFNFLALIIFNHQYLIVMKVCNIVSEEPIQVSSVSSNQGCEVSMYHALGMEFFTDRIVFHYEI